MADDATGLRGVEVYILDQDERDPASLSGAGTSAVSCAGASCGSSPVSS